MTHDDVQRWLDRYLKAWKTYDESEIADLFSENAEYRYHPWDDPEVGRAMIVQDWLNPAGDPAKRDAPGTFVGEYTAWAVDGSKAVAIGTSSYYEDASRARLVRLYWNSWLLEFDAEGRCSSFVEYYMQQKV